MSNSPPSCRVNLLALALAVACGPGPATTSGSTGSTTDASSTSTGTTTGTTDAPITTTGTTDAPTSTGVTSTGEQGNPCGCDDDEVCVQHFDGLCTAYARACVPNPDGCVPAYPCALACQPLCDGDSVDACNNSDCPDEIDGAVHCFGI